MSDATKTLQIAGEAGDGSAYKQPVTIVDADGNPVDIGSGSSTPAAGSITPVLLNGYNAGTGHSKMVKVKADGSGFDFVNDSTTPAAGSVTNAMLAGGITADKLAKGVVPAAPVAATQTTAGLVKQAAPIAALATGATLEQLVTAFNDLVAKCKAAGFFG